MAGHVDAGGGDGQGRAAGEIADRADLLREALRHLDVLLPVEAELRAEAQDEVYGVRGRRGLVRVGLGKGAFRHHTVNTCR